MILIKTIFKWGAILGVSVAVGTQILTWMGLGLTNWFLVLTYILVVTFAILSLFELKHKEETKFNLISSLIMIIGMIILSRFIFQTYMFMYTRYIDPTWIDTVAKTWTTSMQESNTDPSLIQRRIDGFRQAYEIIPMYTSALVSYAIPQFVLGIIVSIIFFFTAGKKKSKT